MYSTVQSATEKHITKESIFPQAHVHIAEAHQNSLRMLHVQFYFFFISSFPVTQATDMSVILYLKKEKKK